MNSTAVSMNPPQNGLWRVFDRNTFREKRDPTGTRLSEPLFCQLAPNSKQKQSPARNKNGTQLPLARYFRRNQTNLFHQEGNRKIVRIFSTSKTLDPAKQTREKYPKLHPHNKVALQYTYDKPLPHQAPATGMFHMKQYADSAPRILRQWQSDTKLRTGESGLRCPDCGYLCQS